MKEFKMNVVRFDEKDVIATSTVAFVGFGDGDNTNNVIAGFTLDPNASGNRFNYNVNNVLAALNEKFGVTDITGSTYIVDFDGKGSKARLGNTVSVGYTTDTRVFKYNTTFFKYDYTTKQFTRCQ